MGLFGCSHKYREYQHGQLVCSKCGAVKNGKTPRGSLTHSHTWRGMKGQRHQVYCTECGVTKSIR